MGDTKYWVNYKGTKTELKPYDSSLKTVKNNRMKFYEFYKCNCYSLVCANGFGEAVSYFTHSNNMKLTESEMPEEVSKYAVIQGVTKLLRLKTTTTEKEVKDEIDELMKKGKAFALISSKDLD